MASKEEKKPGADTGRQPGTELQVYDFGDDAGKGMQDVKSDEFRIPFLRILQANSPQCNPVEAGGTPGAVAGSILNTSTGEVWNGKDGFEFLPVQRKHDFIEWIPRNDDGSGGGFVGIHSPDEPIVGQLRAVHGRFGKLPMDNSHELVETFSLFGLALHGTDSPFGAVIGFSSTQISKYQKFIARYMNIQYPGPNGMVRPPLWAHRWKFTTIFEQKAAFKWYGWRVDLAMDGEPRNSLVLRTNTELLIGGRTHKSLYEEAKGFYDLIESGKAKVDYNQAGDGAAREPGDDSNDIPM